MTNNEIIKNREQLIVKSNQLITGVSLGLTEIEQRVVVFAISKIKPEQKDFSVVKFTLEEYRDVCGIKRGGRSDDKIKASIKSLADKSKFIHFRNNPKDKGREILIRWFENVEIDCNTNAIEVKFHYALKPYLLELKDKFTAYPLVNTLSLSGKHAIRLYEILKSYSYKGEFEIALDEFRTMLNLEKKYPTYGLLNFHVIAPSVEQINFFTDIMVEYYPIKNSRSIVGIEFIVNVCTTESNHEKSINMLKKRAEFAKIQEAKKESKKRRVDALISESDSSPLEGQYNLFEGSKEGNNK